VNLSSYPSITAALAAERHGRFVVEADHVRRLIQADGVHGRDTAGGRFLRAARVKVLTAATWVASWAAATSPLSTSWLFVKGEGLQDATARTG
jgi:glycine/D-amino acid oxidase-like deaminating enzyme